MLIGVDASRAIRALRTGTERYALEITRALVSSAPEDRFILYLDRAPPAGLLPHSSRVRWRVIPAPRLWTVGRLSLEMLHRPPDVLFVPAHSLPPRVPPTTVTTIHDLGYLHFPEEHSAVQRRLRHAANRWSVSKATRIIAVSNATRDDLIGSYGVDPSRIRVVHHGLGSAFRPVEDAGTLARVRARYGLDEPYFLFVGTIQPRKNYERLLAAFRRFTELTHEPHVLVLAGAAGWQSKRLSRALADARLGCKVRILGYLDEADLPAVLSCATALTFPSLYEGFGLPAVEAMACGAPVLTSNTTSFPEVVADAGLLVDPLSVEAIARAMLCLAEDDSLRISLRDRGLARAANFTWKRAGRETLAVLREAVNSRMAP